MYYRLAQFALSLSNAIRVTAPNCARLSPSRFREEKRRLWFIGFRTPQCSAPSRATVSFIASLSVLIQPPIVSTVNPVTVQYPSVHQPRMHSCTLAFGLSLVTPKHMQFAVLLTVCKLYAPRHVVQRTALTHSALQHSTPMNQDIPTTHCKCPLLETCTSYQQHPA